VVLGNSAVFDNQPHNLDTGHRHARRARSILVEPRFQDTLTGRHGCVQLSPPLITRSCHGNANFVTLQHPEGAPSVRSW
jgi:hypothetical protein